MAKPQKHPVSFMAEKKVKVPEQVAFVKKTGEVISFPAHKKIKMPVEVDFEARNK